MRCELKTCDRELRQNDRIAPMNGGDRHIQCMPPRFMSENGITRFKTVKALAGKGKR